jgi:RNA polymerase sigma-70 factor (ECF subfamily)
MPRVLPPYIRPICFDRRSVPTYNGLSYGNGYSLLPIVKHGNTCIGEAGMRGGQLLGDALDGSLAMGGKPQDDAALIQSIAKGNKLALRVLFARHNLRVFRFALRFSQDRATAEAFVSDVFLQVWRNAKTYNGGSQASTWVLSITRNLVISKLTRSAQESFDEAGAWCAEDVAGNLELLPLKKQHVSIFAQCLTSLTAMHREIIDLVYYHERSLDEVALITGLSRNTVKSRMFYARRELARLLRESDIDREGGTTETRVPHRRQVASATLH